MKKLFTTIFFADRLKDIYLLSVCKEGFTDDCKDAKMLMFRDSTLFDVSLSDAVNIAQHLPRRAIA